MIFEWAQLEGGPADGARIRVSGRPLVLQVTADCPVDGQDAESDVRVAALYIYRRKHSQPPLRYGWDWASP